VGKDRARYPLPGPFPHPPRENRAYGFHHTTAHARRASVGSSFAGFSRCIPPDSHPVSRPTTTASRLRCFPLYVALPRSSGGASLPRVLPPIRHLAYAGVWSLLGAFPQGALPISGFVPARALEGSTKVSPGLRTALLHIPCKVSRVPYDGLSNMVEVVVRCPSQPRSAAPSLRRGMSRLAPLDLPACPCNTCCRYPSP
jgi:hypothetical protein